MYIECIVLKFGVNLNGIVILGFMETLMFYNRVFHLKYYGKNIGNINAVDTLLIYKSPQRHIQFCNIGTDQAMNNRIK